MARMLWLVIAAGGALGAAARHGLNVVLHSRFLSTTFPAGIFVVNVVGCATVGLLAGLLAVERFEAGEYLRAFVFVGVLGGFTTFSSFGLDTLVLARGGQAGLAAFNAVGQPVVGLAAVWLGFAAGSWRP
jgi:fluoride exporter